MPAFTHPSGNGYTESVDLIPCIIWVALFGPLYAAYKRAWLAALILLFLNPLAAIVALAIGSAAGPIFGGAAWVAGVSIIGWGCVPAIEEAYLKRGWRRA